MALAISTTPSYPDRAPAIAGYSPAHRRAGRVALVLTERSWHLPPVLPSEPTGSNRHARFYFVSFHLSLSFVSSQFAQGMCEFEANGAAAQHDEGNSDGILAEMCERKTFSLGRYGNPILKRVPGVVCSRLGLPVGAAAPIRCTGPTCPSPLPGYR